MKHSIKILGKVMTMVLFFFLVAGCKKKDCSATVCGYNQVCNSGNCYCRDGYEGDSCNVLSSPRYVNGGRNYFVQESCSGSSGSNYTAFITAPYPNPAQLDINNFLPDGYTITAFIRGTSDKKGTFIEIPSQSLGGSGTVTGQGNYDIVSNPHRLVINFEYTLNNQNKACTHTFYPQ